MVSRRLCQIQGLWGVLLLEASPATFLTRRRPYLLQSYAMMTTTENTGNASERITCQKKAFVDRMIVQARAGHGGQGCASVRMARSRTKKMQPDGGNGGDGGDVILKASKRVKSLAGLPQLLVSTSGENGSSKKKHGKRGRDGVYLVPMGTHVRRYMERDNMQMKHTIDVNHVADGRELEAGGEHCLPLYIDLDEDETSSAKRLNYVVLKDLLEDGDTVVVAKGGTGGQGNAGYVSWRHRRNRQAASCSTFGEFVRLELEMKMLSDVSLVGFPNVGKSSLLRKISSAMPRVGSYAFTTITPQLGTVSLDMDSFTVSDVPGLVQGAHDNKGLGHRFLRHVERTATIVYVLDAHGAYALTGPTIQSSHGDNPVLSPEEQFMMLRDELEQYSKDLIDKKFMIVLNKMDLIENKEAFKQAFLSWVSSTFKVGPCVPQVSFVTCSDENTPNQNRNNIDCFIRKIKSIIDEER